MHLAIVFLCTDWPIYTRVAKERGEIVFAAVFCLFASVSSDNFRVTRSLHLLKDLVARSIDMLSEQ